MKCPWCGGELRTDGISSAERTRFGIANKVRGLIHLLKCAGCGVVNTAGGWNKCQKDLAGLPRGDR